MKITETLELATRKDWRSWLEQHHDSKKEIWLVRSNKEFSYLDSVEEALCFGWIDGIAKKTDTAQLAQRFTPRKKKVTGQNSTKNGPESSSKISR
jgi:uncharacterized protein YdeI (YjbR/CyaY-like superfamily)